MADTETSARRRRRARGAGRRAGCERSLPERHRRRDQRRGRRGDGGGPCGPAHRDRVDPRDVPGRRDRGRRGGRAQDGPRDGRRVGDRPDRRHQQLRPRHPRLGTAVAAVVDGEPVAAATVAPALGDVYTADTDGAYRNGESMCVSDVSNPRRATVDPTLWWDFDSRDEYAAACEAIVRRFSDLRRFGAAQIVLPTVAAGGLGTISNLRANPWDSVAGVFMVRQAGESDGYRGEPLATRLNRARRLERESPRRSARRGARDRGTRLRGRLHCEESEATLTQTAACRALAPPPRGRRGRGWSRRRTARSRRAGRS